jgi:hypothetical protein
MQFLALLILLHLLAPSAIVLTMVATLTTTPQQALARMLL